MNPPTWRYVCRWCLRSLANPAAVYCRRRDCQHVASLPQPAEIHPLGANRVWYFTDGGHADTFATHVEHLFSSHPQRTAVGRRRELDFIDPVDGLPRCAVISR